MRLLLEWQVFFQGKLDDIAIYNRALLQSEITALYTGIASCSPTSSTTNITICPNALPYTWNGKTLNVAGTLKDTLTNAAGCDSIATLNLTVTTQPTPTSNNICVGSTLQLTNAASGGVWASLNNRASVGATGLVTGKNAGAAIITYKKNNVATTYNITVNANPIVPNIMYAAGSINPQVGAGTGNYCNNRTFGIVGLPNGGVFTSSNNNILTINCSGVVKTLGVGSASLTYTYTNSFGCSSSRAISGNVVSCAARGMNGIMNNEQGILNNEFTIYPNPAKSFINLQFENLFGAGTIAIIDLYGKQLKTQSLSLGANIIDISSLRKGMYFVSVITNETKTTKKLLVE